MSDQRNPSNAPANGAGPETPARPRLRSDDKVAILVIVFAIIIFGISTTFDDVPRALTQGVPPESYPQLLAGALIVLAVFLFFEARTRPEKTRKRPPIMVLYTALVLVAAIVSIDWLGIFGAMVIACAVIPPLWGDRRYKVIGPFIVLVPLVVYGLFHGVLKVQFPLGIFQNMF